MKNTVIKVVFNKIARVLNMWLRIWYNSTEQSTPHHELQAYKAQHKKLIGLADRLTGRCMLLIRGR